MTLPPMPNGRSNDCQQKAEWEYAARGRLAGKEYVWGNEEPTEVKANSGANVGITSAVGCYAANGYGLYDMAGNVGSGMPTGTMKLL